MTRRTTFIGYHPKRILNKQKRADHWFWTRYSAYPYIGCQHGCDFCYCRERKYSPYDDPADFARVIKVKTNAPELLHRELRRAPLDMVFTGDYQPVERIYRISRRMLEACLELSFPVFVLERSPLVCEDLDLLRQISERAAAVVAFSALSTPDSPNYAKVRAIEHLAPPAEKRFEAMEKFARAGVLTGACLMPILPGLSDDDATLENVVRWTAEHGGRFVLAGGLTLADQQRDYFLDILRQRHPELVTLYSRLYPTGSYGPTHWDWPRIGLRIKALCERYGIRDRIPRPVIPGERLATNKRVVEALANRSYDMELHSEPARRVWAYRKAAWAIEDLDVDLRLIYDQLETKGLGAIPGVGMALAPEVESMLVALR